MCARNEDVFGRETTRLQTPGRFTKKPVKRHQKEKDEVRRFIGHHAITRAKSLQPTDDWERDCRKPDRLIPHPFKPKVVALGRQI